ncbi:MAG: regulatory protein RecX, partial [Angustibacter sp.]
PRCLRFSLTPRDSAGPSELGVDLESTARAVVLRQLTLAPRSRAQLAEALARRSIPEDVVTRVLDRMTEVGLVDDASFASGWVRHRHAQRGLSRRALAHELRTRGVDADAVDQALQAVDDDAERAAATRLVDRRLRAMTGVPPDKQISRLAAMLTRKGYPGPMIREVVRQAVAEPVGDPASTDSADYLAE